VFVGCGLFGLDWCLFIAVCLFVWLRLFISTGCFACLFVVFLFGVVIFDFWCYVIVLYILLLNCWLFCFCLF